MWSRQYYRKPLRIVWNTVKGIIATPMILIGVTLLMFGMLIMGEEWGQ
jgi:uncharacterized membrane protein